MGVQAMISRGLEHPGSTTRPLTTEGYSRSCDGIGSNATHTRRITASNLWFEIATAVALRGGSVETFIMSVASISDIIVNILRPLVSFW